MARGKRQRFSFLKKALKAAGGSAATGSRLGNYSDFEKGLRKIEVNKKLTAAQRKRYAIALLPFNKTAPTSVDSEDYYKSTITSYSNEGRKTLGSGLNDAKLGYNTIAAGNQSGDGFYPAILRLFVPTNAQTPTATTPTSAVTGQKYSRTAGASFTVPFGRGGLALADGEETRRADLASAAKTGASATVKATSVSYEPEFFANPTTDVPALPG